ncbi:MAG TPA: hypothetical protein VHS79_23660 [Actinomycetes bacterium]|jgi:hypothetical protein|nr:hypothetical protein [Actinomycetes bacterium]
MSRGARSAVLAGLVLCLLAGLAGPAWAGPWVDRAAGNLRDDPLYVNPSARPTLSLPDQERIRARLAVVGTPVFVAILPGQALGEADGDANRLAALVAASVARPGTYLVVAGGEEGAGSNTLARGQASGRARVAFRRHPELVTATMDFISRVEDAAGTPPATTSPTTPPPGQEDSDGTTVLVVLLAVAGVVALSVLLALFRENRTERRTIRSGNQFSEAKAAAQDDLNALADDLRNLNVDLQAEEAGNPRAVSQYTRAYEFLERAEQAFEQARSPADLAQVSSAVESGRYSMSAARALFERRDPPRRRPPCFFDTRHGPSVNDIGWEPPYGPPRPVPACAACMRQIASGSQPQPRRVRAGLRRVPFYEAPPHFESWFGGYFGGAAADLVAGFPLGKALDDGFVGGRNNSGGGYGYLPVSYADTGVLDSGGAITGERELDSVTITIQEDPDEDQSAGAR